MFHYIALVLCAFISVGLAVPIIPNLQLEHTLQTLQKSSQCAFPNGTDTSLHAFNCDGSRKIAIKSVQVLNANNEPMYPISLKEKITLVFQADNHGDVYVAQTVNIVVKKYQKKQFGSGCAWKELSTYGLLNSMNGCLAKNCPIQKGQLELHIPLDLTAWSGLISMLAIDGVYELELRFYNDNKGAPNHEEISCVVAQTKVV